MVGNTPLSLATDLGSLPKNVSKWIKKRFSPKYAEETDQTQKWEVPLKYNIWPPSSTVCYPGQQHVYTVNI